MQHIPNLAVRITLSVIIKKQSNFISSLLLSQKRLETKVPKVRHIPGLALRMVVSKIIKKQPNFFSTPLVSQKRLKTKVQKGEHIPILAMRIGDYKKVIEFSQQSLSIANEIGDKGLEGAAYTKLGYAYYSLCDYKRATNFTSSLLVS